MKIVKIFQNYIDTGFMLYPRESQKTLACVAGQSLFEDANRTDTHVPPICILPRCFSNMTERFCFQFKEDLNNFGHFNCFDYLF